jgi:hypothetical protein
LGKCGKRGVGVEVLKAGRVVLAERPYRPSSGWGTGSLAFRGFDLSVRPNVQYYPNNIRTLGGFLRQTATALLLVGRLGDISRFEPTKFLRTNTTPRVLERSTNSPRGRSLLKTSEMMPLEVGWRSFSSASPQQLPSRVSVGLPPLPGLALRLAHLGFIY